MLDSACSQYMSNTVRLDWPTNQSEVIPPSAITYISSQPGVAARQILIFENAPSLNKTTMGKGLALVELANGRVFFFRTSMAVMEAGESLGYLLNERIEWMLALGLMLTMFAVCANAESPREQLKQMVEQLQQRPTDDALREQIIKLAQQLKPAPALPEEAERHMAYGAAAFTGAKAVADYKEAAKEFEQATLAAPWYGDAYFNLGVAQDKAENYAAALRSLKLALLASPDSKDIKALIYQVEYRNKKAHDLPRTGLSFRDCPDCPEMVVLPAGGGRAAFAMGKYEVTQGQWRAIMGNNPSHFQNCGDTCPVEKVSWNDAKEFIQRLNQKTGKQYRLPTEAEWEYACRAGSQQEYCGSDDVNSVAWYDRNSGSATHPAGRKRPNAFGLYDMSGNVWEWAEDCYDGDCAWRVLRGGSWGDVPRYSRAAFRFRFEPAYRGLIFGFRLARMLP